MFNVDLHIKKNIHRNIEKFNKRKVGELNDSWFLKTMLSWLIITMIVGIDLIFDNIVLATFYPPMIFMGFITITLNELRVWRREVKAHKELNNVVNVLDEVEIKTNVENLSKSVMLENVEFTNEVRDDKLLSNNCYVFTDNNGKLQGLLEDYNGMNKEYYVLDEKEVEMIKEHSPKVRKLVKRMEK